MIGAGCCEYFSGGLGAELKNQRRHGIGTGALHVEMVDFWSGSAVGRRYLVLSKTQRCKEPYPVGDFFRWKSAILGRIGSDCCHLGLYRTAMRPEKTVVKRYSGFSAVRQSSS